MNLYFQVLLFQLSIKIIILPKVKNLSQHNNSTLRARVLLLKTHTVMMILSYFFSVKDNESMLSKLAH